MPRQQLGFLSFSSCSHLLVLVSAFRSFGSSLHNVHDKKNQIGRHFVLFLSYTNLRKSGAAPFTPEIWAPPPLNPSHTLSTGLCNYLQICGNSRQPKAAMRSSPVKPNIPEFKVPHLKPSIAKLLNHLSNIPTDEQNRHKVRFPQWP